MNVRVVGYGSKCDHPSYMGELSSVKGGLVYVKTKKGKERFYLWSGRKEGDSGSGGYIISRESHRKVVASGWGSSLQ